MIDSVRCRSDFERLGRHGRRETAAFLWCTWCRESSLSTPKVAFAVTRAYGSAVKRNRLRRRIRHALIDLERSGQVPHAMMLFGTRRPKHPHQTTSATKPNTTQSPERMFEPTFQQVLTDVTTILSQIRQQLPNTPELNA